MSQFVKRASQLLKVFDLNDIVGLDFETYFAKDYTLRSPKMATSEYVRDKRFKAQCLGIQHLRQRKPRWYATDEIQDYLDSIDWSRTGIIAHHAHFDGLILSEHYNVVPKVYFDTLSMARPLLGHHIGAGLDEVAKLLGFAGKEKADALQATKGIRDLPPELLNPLGDYCADDVSDMWGIFKILLEEFPISEFRLVDLTVRAFADPVCPLDKKLIQEVIDEEVEAKTDLLKRAGKIIGEKGFEVVAKRLSSSPQFADILREQGVEPPMKPSPTPGKGPIYAFAKTDLEFQALASSPNKKIATLAEARLNAKSTIDETRARRMYLRATTGNKRFPIYLNYGKAHTLRWTGGDKVNPQNFRRGGKLRRSIRAPRGQKVIVVDSSQIEPRTNCRLWRQNDVLEIFRTGGDPYCDLATEIYRREITKKDFRERFVGKVGVLGLGYQMGAEKYQTTLAIGALGPPVQISFEEAELVVRTYRRKNFRIVQGWRYLESMLALMAYSDREVELEGVLRFRKDGIDTISGLSLEFPDLRGEYNPRTDQFQNFSYKSKRSRTHIYGGKLNENIVQHLARQIVAEQMLEIADRYRVVTMTHDEVVYLAPTKQAEEAYRFGVECLSKSPTWWSDIPLGAEGGYDKVYSK